MAPANQNSIEADKLDPRRPDIILFTLPSLSFSTPLQSVNIQISLRTTSSDKLFRMGDRSSNSRATFGSHELIPAPAPGRATPASSVSTISSRDVTHLVQESTRLQIEMAAVKRDVAELKPRMEDIETRMTNLENKVDKLENKVDKLETRMDFKFSQVDRKLDQILHALGSGAGRASMSVPDLPASATDRGARRRGTGGGGTFRQNILDRARNILHRVTNEATTGLRELEDEAIEEEGGHTHRQAAAGPSRARGPQSLIGQPILPGHR
ncbi:hypothetical protein BN946_scf184790.g14 [Trametes cinnabarina]|uniref:Uncharacterized protein n=1 Tax=Pycnoporus cinnabarinus TaxID=5643 RepID=A0A060S2X2_PYCCI|nr:hypothetical protein BN946_scf184790.g14 [Trametes cinnabarina]